MKVQPPKQHRLYDSPDSFPFNLVDMTAWHDNKYSSFEDYFTQYTHIELKHVTKQQCWWLLVLII